MIKFPNINWKQTNRSDILGSLWASWNLDLTDNLGATRVSPRTLLINDDTANMGVPAAFEFFNGAWWTVAGARLFSNSGATNGNFSQDATSGTPTTCDSDESDLELFNGFLYASATAGLFKLTAGGNWSADLDGGVLTTAFPHLLLAFGDRLYVTDDGCIIHSLNTSDTFASPNGPPNTTSYALDLSVYGGSAKNTISSIRATTQYIWIGTLNRSQGKGRVYYWDGASPTPNGYVELDSAGALAMVIKDDVPVIVDANGALLQLNGGTFKEIARLPYDRYKFLETPYDIDHTDRFIHPNGIAIVDNKINILVRNLNFDDADTINENFPSGVWEYDEEIGLYHKFSLSYHAFTDGSVTDYGQNFLTKVGALVSAKNNSQASTADGSMLIGAQYSSDDTPTNKEGIWINNAVETKQKFGYLVTTKIFSANVDDIWKKIWVRVKKLLDSSDFITVKYRTADVSPTTATITWTSTTTCTTTTNVSAFIGYEMEVLRGKGGGKCSKITNVTESGGTYTITLQETFTGATSGTAKARFQYWIEAGKLTDQTVQTFQAPTTESGQSPWIQFKICMQFTGKNELYDLILINERNKTE